MIFKYLFLILLLKSPFLFADSEEKSEIIQFNGKVFTDFYVPSTKMGSSSYQQISQSAWMQLHLKPNEQTKGYLELTGNHFDKSIKTGSNSTGFSLGLREAYGKMNIDSFTITIGKQILPWGKADGINPTDFLTAKDSTFLNPEEEMKRIGATSVQISKTNEHTPITFTYVFTPIAPHSVLYIKNDLLPTQVSVQDFSQPNSSLSGAEHAFKIEYNKSNWDLSLSAFRGYNHMPEYTLSSTGGTILSPTYSFTPTLHKIKAVGSDFSIAFDDWIFRVESAYIETENKSGSNPTIQPSHFDSVAGIEKPLFKDFRIQPQFMFRKYFYFKDLNQATGSNAIETAGQVIAASSNALLLNYQEAFRPSASFRCGYNPQSLDVDFDFFIAYNFKGHDYVTRPKMSYLWNDSVRFTLGWDRYIGDSNRPFGAMKTSNAIFTEAKVAF